MLVLLAGFALSDGAGQVSAVDEGKWARNNTACWVTGPIGSQGSPGGDSDIPSLRDDDHDNWGSSDEFVVDFGDLVDYPDGVKGESFAPGQLGANTVDSFSVKYRDGLGIGIVEGKVSYVFYEAGEPFTGRAHGVKWDNGFPFSGVLGRGFFVSGVSYPGVVTQGSHPDMEYSYTTEEALASVRELRKAIQDTAHRGRPNAILLAKSFVTITDSLGRPVGYFNKDNLKVGEFYPVPSRPTDAQLKTFSFGTHALFKNFPEAVDYTFAADVLLGPDQQMNDLRMKYLVYLLKSGGSNAS